MLIDGRTSQKFHRDVLLFSLNSIRGEDASLAVEVLENAIW